MKHYLIFALVFFNLTSCAKYDARYYQLNPKALYKAVKECKTDNSGSLSCEELMRITASVNELAYQLQRGPQEFGRKILALQERLAKQKAELASTQDPQGLNVSITATQQELAERLAIVKWLESPEA